MYLFFQTFFARKLALIFTMTSLWTLLSKYFISMVSERPWSILCSSSWLRVNKGQNCILYNIRMSLLKSRIAELQFLRDLKKIQPFLSHHTLWGWTILKSTEFDRLLFKILTYLLQWLSKKYFETSTVFSSVLFLYREQPLLEWFYKVLILGCFLPRLTDICLVDVEKMNILAFKSYRKTGIKHWPKT